MSGAWWRRSLPWGVILLALLAAAVAPADAAMTLVEGEKGNLNAEFRFMFWAVDGGPDLAPAGLPDQEENIQDFLVRRARFVLRARHGERLEGYIQLGQDNIGSKLLTVESGIRVKDLYVNYRFAPGFQVVAGQFKVPFLRQNLESSFNQMLIDRAVLTAFRPARESSRDLGLMAWGNFGGFQYRAAALDGSDQEDDNPRSSLRGTLRVAYNWFTPETGLGYTGTTVGQKKILQIGAQADAQNGRMDPRDSESFQDLLRDYRNYAAEFFYEQPFAGGSALTFEGAWLSRRDEYEDPATPPRDVHGYYLQGGLLFPMGAERGALQIVARQESFDTDRGAEVITDTLRTLGLNWFFRGHDAKLQIDYTDWDEEPTPVDSNLVRLSLAFVF